jgi:hypothetical protein
MKDPDVKWDCRPRVNARRSAANLFAGLADSDTPLTERQLGDTQYLHPVDISRGLKLLRDLGLAEKTVLPGGRGPLPPKGWQLTEAGWQRHAQNDYETWLVSR